MRLLESRSLKSAGEAHETTAAMRLSFAAVYSATAAPPLKPITNSRVLSICGTASICDSA